MLVDSHCHLNFPDFAPDLDQVVTRAREAGVFYLQTICTDRNEFDQVRGIAERYDIGCSVGVHPNDCAQNKVDTEWLIERTSYPQVIGIGETGLDYHYEHSPRAEQQASFHAHIACAQATGLPLIVHTRNADEDTIAILTSEMQRQSFPGVIHCFSSTRFLAEEALKLGFYISISGIATFKKAEELRSIIGDVPLNRLLVETDAPYLAPVPHRGHRNEPAFVRHVNSLVAGLKHISEKQCATATTDNFFRLFSKAKRPGAGA